MDGMARPTRVEVPFVGPTYAAESVFASPEECINMYLRPLPGNKFMLIGTPGLQLWATVGDGPIRGSLVVAGVLYVVSGIGMYSVGSLGSSTLLGNVTTGLGKVSMATNGLSVIVVDGSAGYHYDISTGVFTSPIPDFPGGDVVEYIDGYYITNRPGTGQWYQSDFNDGLTWGALAFDTAGGSVDNVVSILVDHLEVWVMGEDSSEIWYNAGLPTFNFVRIDGAFVEMGAASPQAVCRIDGGVFWLGKDEFGDAQVFRALNRQPKTISTFPISHYLSGFDLSQASLWAYQQGGHPFVVVDVGRDNPAVVFDSTTTMWHKRSSHIGGKAIGWRVWTHSVAYGEHIVGDRYNGNLYKLRQDVYDEAGADMQSVRITPVVRDRQNRITVNEFELTSQPGVGLITGSPEDVSPKGMISWSRDGGRTWSAEHDVSLGAIGDTFASPSVHQLGQGRNWVFKLRITDAVRRYILGANVGVEAND